MIASLALLAAAAIEQPETLLCPKQPGDLDYAIYTVMKAARMDPDPAGGAKSFRRDVSKGLSPRALRVNFQTFRTSEGTRLVAELAYVDTFTIRPVDDPKVTTVFQHALDQMREQMPCA